MRNLITDVPGLAVGSADDAALASGVTAVVFEWTSVAAVAIHGGAPGVRDTALLEPEMIVEGVDALVLSGGSAFGLDAMGGVQGWLRACGRGFPVGEIRIPIVPGVILFDLLNGGDKGWKRQPPYWELGWMAASVASKDFALGTAGAGYGATTADLKGGLGSVSTRTSAGYTVGALAAVNGLGRTTIGATRYFWASAHEKDAEFGGLGFPAPLPHDALVMQAKGDSPQNTTIAVVATDAVLTKGQAKRLAVMAHDGMAIAIRPAHCALDGDTIFAASTGRHERVPTLRDLTELGMAAADAVARAMARGVYEATALPFPGALPAWRDRR